MHVGKRIGTNVGLHELTGLSPPCHKVATSSGHPRSAHPHWQDQPSLELFVRRPLGPPDQRNHQKRCHPADIAIRNEGSREMIN